jgi:hypothetical protein
MKKQQGQRKLSQSEQSARFKETARRLGADERPEEFERVLKAVAPRKKKVSAQKT